MLKLKPQYFGHLMQRTDSLEKTLMLEKTEGRRRRGWQRMRWLESIINSMDMCFSQLWETAKDREVWCVTVHGVAELDTTEQPNNKLNTVFIYLIADKWDPSLNSFIFWDKWIWESFLLWFFFILYFLPWSLPSLFFPSVCSYFFILCWWRISLMYQCFIIVKETNYFSFGFSYGSFVNVGFYKCKIHQNFILI